ncbi:MAG: SusC/RagA family TonB-linked outer membrane protein [Prevotella sp.]|jgi:TonB-linked SusC/RagA family outer membrane protein|nr:SusC/RagA family TonB-linked outer membrane protein [Prevotella sp.]
MKKLSLFLTCFFISIGIAIAQDKHVSGVVVDETGEPVIGASVIVKGTTVGTATDVNGAFNFNVPSNANTLTVKFIGYADKEIAAGTNVKVTLSPNATALEEVVISVAYGVSKRSALTGAVTSLDAKSIEQRPTTNIASLLEGKMGIMVQSETGQPGSSSSVRIRGFGSVNGSNAPLYVVDGFVYEGNLSDLNAADIAEMSVLKDASSAAIYGNRAANGVILITTKRGNSEKPHITLTMNQGFDSRSLPEYDLLGIPQWMETTWISERNRLMSTDNTLTLADANARTNETIVSNYYKYNIFDKANDQLFDANGKFQAQVRDGYKGDLDWFDAGTRNGHRQEYIMSGDGRIGAKSDYYFSAGYLDQKGYTPNAQFKRFSGRAKVNMAPTNWFRTGFNISGSDQLQSNMVDGGGVNGLFYIARIMAPIYPVHVHDAATGDYVLDASGQKIYDDNSARPQHSGRNIIWHDELNKNDRTRKTISGNIFAEITFLKDFRAKVSGSLDTQIDQRDVYESALVEDGKTYNGRAEFQNYRYKTYTFLQQLTYSKAINDLYHIDVLAAHENFSYNRVYSNGSKGEEIFAGIPDMVNFTSIRSLGGYTDNRRTESYLSRVQLNYDEKYYLDGSFRRDGSSRFYVKNRWGNFFSVGAAWEVSKEPFMKDIENVNYLKLRANYGETGNDASVGTYGYMALYEILKNGGKGALVKSQLESLNIKWEASTSFGLALDGRVFDRFNFSLEYFDKRSRDLLFDVNLPQSAGAFYDGRSPSVTQNIGSVANRGFELNLDAEIIRTKDFSWHAGLNATALKNKILTLPDQNKQPPYYGIINGTKKYTEGHSLYDFWTYQFVGVDQMSGRSLYELDTEGCYVADAAIPGETRTLVPADKRVNINGMDYVYSTTYAKRDFSGSAIPKLMGNFSTGINYKGIALDLIFTYALGNKVYDAPYRELMNLSTPFALHKDILNSWNGVPEGMTETSPNRIDPKGIPVINGSSMHTENNEMSNRWLVNGSYLMFKNINLSYSLPKNWIKQLDLSAVRVNVTAENLYLFTARKGLNSQMSFNGNVDYQASTPRVVSLGIKVDF